MAIVLALPALYDAVVARLEADAEATETTAPASSFGWREPARQPRGHRIVWVPGDDESGELGEVLAARNPGRDPRPLATVRELVTVYLEAHDASAPEDERAQYQAARVLFDAWLRAVHLAAHGTFAIESARWMNERKERRFGAALRVLASVEAMVPDAPTALVDDARAVVDVEELDLTEQIESAPAPEAPEEPEEPEEP